MSLALTRMQTFTRVVLPPALQRVWPALVSQIIIVMLGSALTALPFVAQSPVMPPFGLLLLPFLLIAKQPDLGTGILVLAAGLYVIFFAGLPWKLPAWWPF